MMRMPLTIGRMHFVGIGGIGMSGIAEVMKNLGYDVSGSDMSENANVKRLRGLGIPVAIGHDAANVEGAAVVVVSTAVKRTNPEVAAARENMIPVVRRAEMLAELMRLKWSISIAGTHGKTTTTSLVAQMLDSADLDPTVINGGIINAYGTNARLGRGDWLVAEADESDGTFIKLPATVAVVTNIDPEHMDHYGDFDTLRAAFRTFIDNLPFYGFAMVCLDHPEVQALIGRIEDRRLITYGFSPQAEVRGENLCADPTGLTFDVALAIRGHAPRRIEGLKLPMHGDHNVQNALAAIGVAVEMGIDDATIAKALAAFGGVKRRFTRTGEWHGVTVIDDYGHHPVEIAAVLRAARQATEREVIAVVQPHRYSRLHNLFEDFCTCFNDADRVIVTPVYAAGEDPVEGADRDSLAAGLKARGHRGVATVEGPEDLADQLARTAKPGDLVVCLGAGSITQWANAMPEMLAARGAPGGEA
ncbi:UDP-N-acetylmuramate--L-alanine ligase [Marivibrio halodurans]|uniref:UDP-N-acetylmuramate--L-alanine ligase n=1 Tax=Marivibrio halodurans TaxID=2039722 RepID=A0A8J7SN12_9PROT|nr:UDP-N-acetylmuramate--L-alanine ligase [Marivibrio halodurans]MBP5857733.1 UDP-N-acetylmuramate--L-alanine ligase [Marivibrio halodurans]